MKKPNSYISFCALITRHSALKSLRKNYARLDPQKRRMAAQWEYDSSMASNIFNMSLHGTGAETLPQPRWPPGFLSLAIDPLFAPALLTVGSLEYQHDFVKEAMELFLMLAQIPKDEDKIAEIIDSAGDFLLDHEDYKNALALYFSAEKVDPTQALYYMGSGYCLHKLGHIEEAIRKQRKAVELEPDNYRNLNDLGYSLLEAGLLDEAKNLLNKSIGLAPSEYKFARNNLKLLQERKRTP